MDRQPQRSPTLGLHDLLLKLAGRLDDSALSHARRLAAVARLDDAVELVTGTLIAGNIALRSDEQRELATLLTTCASEPALAERVVIDDGAVSDAEPHRFSAADAPDTGVADAVGPVVAMLPDVRTVHAVWRNTVAGSVPGPMPQRVVLVDLGPDGAPMATAYRVESALRAAGISAAVEVSSPATTPTEYHRAALAAAVPAIGDVDLEQRSVAEHDQDRQPTAPGRHVVVADAPADAGHATTPTGTVPATDAAGSDPYDVPEPRHDPASRASVPPAQDATSLAERAQPPETAGRAKVPSTGPQQPVGTGGPTATSDAPSEPSREHDDDSDAEPTAAQPAAGPVEDTRPATDQWPATPADQQAGDETPAIANGTTADSPWLTASSFTDGTEQDPDEHQRPVPPVGADVPEHDVAVDDAPRHAATDLPEDAESRSEPADDAEPQPEPTTYAGAHGHSADDEAGPPWTPVPSGPGTARPWPVAEPATPAPEPAADGPRDWPAIPDPDAVATTDTATEDERNGSTSSGATVFAFDAADAVRNRRYSVASDDDPAGSADLAPGELFHAADSEATDVPSPSDISHSIDDPGTPPGAAFAAAPAADAGPAETPEESTDQLSPEDVERLRSAIEQPEDAATIQRTAVAFPSEGLDNPRLSDRDRELLRELHAELAKREREQATQVRLNGREKPGS